MVERELSKEIADRWADKGEVLGIDPIVHAKVALSISKLALHHVRTAEHCMRVGIIAADIGTHLNDQSLQQGASPVYEPKALYYAGSLHDLGKGMVPKELLNKTSTWTAEDATALARHPMDSHDAIQLLGMPVVASLVARHHTFQPNPYPAEADLPEPPQLTWGYMDIQANARVLALADFYDAAHRSDRGPQKSGTEIRELMLRANSDITPIVTGLYKADIFSTERPTHIS